MVGTLTLRDNVHEESLMSLVVIGGHSRTAAKITQYGHGICSANGEACDCATGDHSWAITEERDRTGESDTSRFLVAGASRVFWVRTEQGRLAEAMPTLRDRLKSARNVIIESNSVMKFLRPDLYLTILDPATADFKKSAQEFLDRADAVILHQSSNTPAWQAVSLKPVAGCPVFQIKPPEYVTPQIIEFLRGKLAIGVPNNP
jgi:hypothetical protein